MQPHLPRGLRRLPRPGTAAADLNATAASHAHAPPASFPSSQGAPPNNALPPSGRLSPAAGTSQERPSASTSPVSHRSRGRRRHDSTEIVVAHESWRHCHTSNDQSTATGCGPRCPDRTPPPPRRRPRSVAPHLWRPRCSPKPDAQPARRAGPIPHENAASAPSRYACFPWPRPLPSDGKPHPRLR